MLNRCFGGIHVTHLRLVHAVFSTKQRQRFLSPDVQARLWPLMGGIARKYCIRPFAIGGHDDHAHLLLSLPADLAIAKGMQLVKEASSSWIHETFPFLRNFSWQEGYSAFSVGISDIERVVHYIESQREYHQKKTFEEELIAFLQEHSIPFDPRYVFG